MNVNNAKPNTATNFFIVLPVVKKPRWAAEYDRLTSYRKWVIINTEYSINMATNVITTIRRSRGVAFFLDSSSGFVNIIFSLLALSVLPIPTPAEVSSRQYCRDERLASCYLIPRVKVTIPVITIQRPVQAFLANTTLKISFL